MRDSIILKKQLEGCRKCEYAVREVFLVLYQKEQELFARAQRMAKQELEIATRTLDLGMKELSLKDEEVRLKLNKKQLEEALSARGDAVHIDGNKVFKEMVVKCLGRKGDVHEALTRNLEKEEEFRKKNAELNTKEEQLVNKESELNIKEEQLMKKQSELNKREEHLAKESELKAKEMHQRTLYKCLQAQKQAVDEQQSLIDELFIDSEKPRTQMQTSTSDLTENTTQKPYFPPVSRRVIQQDMKILIAHPATFESWDMPMSMDLMNDDIVRKLRAHDYYKGWLDCAKTCLVSKTRQLSARRNNVGFIAGWKVSKFFGWSTICHESDKPEWNVRLDGRHWKCSDILPDQRALQFDRMDFWHGVQDGVFVTQSDFYEEMVRNPVGDRDEYATPLHEEEESAGTPKPTGLEGYANGKSTRGQANDEHRNIAVPFQGPPARGGIYLGHSSAGSSSGGSYQDCYPETSSDGWSTAAHDRSVTGKGVNDEVLS